MGLLANYLSKKTDGGGSPSGGGGGDVETFKSDSSQGSKEELNRPATKGVYGSGLTSYHKGGKVKKTGPAMLKKGERVLTKAQQKKASAKSYGKKK